MAIKKQAKNLEKQVSKLLKENPNLKKAMNVFGLSMKEYTKALSAITKKSVIISSTNTNGNLG